ncbi:MAG: acyltransferase [Bacteroidales bacterium]|nr:acyltransferase [Bacteroidales bacterium]
MIQDFENRIFTISSNQEFDQIALEIFDFQYNNNLVYKEYIDYLKVKPTKITSIFDIPFLPIEFFKSRKIVSAIDLLQEKTPVVFKSSGTTGADRSKHYVYKSDIYEKSFLKEFKDIFGSPENYTILALLPSYVQTGDSSLVYMVNKLIQLSNNVDSGFYLEKSEIILDIILKNKELNKQIILFGVSYALLDLAESNKILLPELIIIETGGMKGRKKEIIRNELHHILGQKFGTKNIYSEYGMTELLSQAYMLENEFFKPSSTMKVLIRDINDPFTYLSDEKTGGINIIDIANLYSCSFIETKDLGLLKNNKFKVLGRFDNADIRGCNLLTV